ncbi:hypothetical protein AAMO2058_001426900 [Amorphochlora amoebiformis]
MTSACVRLMSRLKKLKASIAYQWGGAAGENAAEVARLRAEIERLRVGMQEAKTRVEQLERRNQDKSNDSAEIGGVLGEMAQNATWLKDAERKRLITLAKKKRKADSLDLFRDSLEIEREIGDLISKSRSRSLYSNLTGRNEIKLGSISEEEEFHQTMRPLVDHEFKTLPDNHISRGTRVRIVNLTRAVEHNGRIGTVLRRDDDDGQVRFEVILDGQSRSVSVHEKHIQILDLKDEPELKTSSDNRVSTVPDPEASAEKHEPDNPALDLPISGNPMPKLPKELSISARNEWYDYKFEQAGCQALMEKRQGLEGLFPVMPEFRIFRERFAQQFLTDEDFLYDYMKLDMQSRDPNNPVPKLEEYVEARDEYTSAVGHFMPDDMLDAITLNRTIMTKAMESLNKYLHLAKNKIFNPKPEDMEKADNAPKYDIDKGKFRLEVIQQRLINRDFHRKKTKVNIAPSTSQVQFGGIELGAPSDSDMEGYAVTPEDPLYVQSENRVPLNKGRVIIDNFASPHECREIIGNAICGLHRSYITGMRSHVPLSGNAIREAVGLIGLQGLTHVAVLREKVRLFVAERFGLNKSGLYNSDTIIERIHSRVPINKYQQNPRYVYWNPHIDKVYKPSYDYSAYLYLSTHGEHFSGGALEFIDEERDIVIHPRMGRLVVFSSGCENLKRTQRVHEGIQFVLKFWFTTKISDSELDDLIWMPPEVRVEVDKIR